MRRWMLANRSPRSGRVGRERICSFNRKIDVGCHIREAVPELIQMSLGVMV